MSRVSPISESPAVPAGGHPRLVLERDQLLGRRVTVASDVDGDAPHDVEKLSIQQQKPEHRTIDLPLDQEPVDVHAGMPACPV